jgi:hypothetical protein
MNLCLHALQNFIYFKDHEVWPETLNFDQTKQSQFFHFDIEFHMSKEVKNFQKNHKYVEIKLAFQRCVECRLWSPNMPYRKIAMAHTLQNNTANQYHKNISKYRIF